MPRLTGNPPDRTALSRALFFVSSGALVFVLGIGVGRYRVFPYPMLEYAKESLDQVVWEAAVAVGVRRSEHAVPSRYEGTGVTRLEEGRIVPGVTLLSGFFDGRNELRLIRADGTVLHRWRTSFKDAFPTSSHIEPAGLRPGSELNVHIHGAHALPDGSLVFNFSGHGTVKLDRCGVTQWTIPRMTHHAVEPAAGGGFWIPSFRYVATASRYPGIAAPFLEPTVLEVSAGGTVEQELSIFELLYKNDLEALIFANGLEGIELNTQFERHGLPNDLVHLNDVEELSAAMAPAFPRFRSGSLLLSMRDYNLVMVADPRTLSVEWYRVGPWIGQHDPDFIGTGSISLFDNANDGTDTGSLFGGSRIVEVDPSTGQVTARYGSRTDQPMFTDVMGQHQRLGDNILMAEARSGRVLEVTEQGEIVWEFINRADPQTVNVVTGALRYSPDYFKVDDWTCRSGSSESRHPSRQ